MKKIFLLFFIIAIYTVTFSVEAADKYCTQKEINRAVQLQNNGWLKIVEQYVEEVTPEELYKNNEQLLKQHKESVKMGLTREKIRYLHVKIQFLKPCVATTEVDEYLNKQNPSGDPDALIPLTGEKGECIVLLMKSYEALKQGNKETADELMKKTVKQCPTVVEDYMTPRFRCDYRLKVFLAMFNRSKSKQYAVNTVSEFPQSSITSVVENRINWGTEMLPGETMWMKFYIYGDATSWCVWVPK